MSGYVCLYAYEYCDIRIIINYVRVNNWKGLFLRLVLGVIAIFSSHLTAEISLNYIYIYSVRTAQ
jgi:hypothetical protein